MQKASGGLAVITGAAGGLGSAFAQKMAERGHDLLLVDRRQESLAQLCETITTRHGVSAEAHVLDLCQRDELQRLAQRLAQMPEIELLANNAGFGTMNYFVDTDAKCLADMADVHVVAPTLLTRAVLPRMIERNRGAVINVSSVGAWFHSTCNVEYGATKSFLAVFSSSLAQELRGTNVRVQALCPGLVRTGFHEVESMRHFNARCGRAARYWMSPEAVVDCSLRKLSGRQVVVIPGFSFRVLGRLAQMPVLQPLMQWATWGPRQLQSTSREHGC